MENNLLRGLGIGDWAIPNPQSPIPKIIMYLLIK